MSQLNDFQGAIRNSQMLRLGSVGIVVLVLLIPVAMIRTLVAERDARNREATSDVSSKWGNTQTITGPVLILPYSVRRTQPSPDGKEAVREESGSAVLL